MSDSKEIMIESASYKTRELGVSHRREAVEFASGHTHPPSHSRQDGECIIETSISDLPEPQDDIYGVSMPRT